MISHSSPLPAVRPRQCAWCLTVMDEAGHYSRPAVALLPDATHGMCPPCQEALYASAPVIFRGKTPR